MSRDRPAIGSGRARVTNGSATCPRRTAGLLGLAALLCVASGCSPSSSRSSGGGGGGGGSGGSGGSQTVGHAPLPIIPKGGGPIFAAVQLVVVTFDSDPDQKAFEAYSSWLVQSSWFQTVGQQYGVGPGTSTNAELADPPPPSDPNDAEEFLTLELKAQNLPPPGPQTLYLVYFPQSASSCAGAPGYHTSFADKPVGTVVFAVTQYCPTGDLTGLQAEELEASHELIEATTDPLYDPTASAPTSTAGYQILDPTNPFFALGGAVAELCMVPGCPACPVPPVVDPATGYLTARVWSNAAAAADDQQPCNPSWTQGYFNVSPSPNTPQVVAAGASVTFSLTGWSAEQTTPPWTIEVAPSGQGFVPGLSFTEDTIQSGQTVALTVTVPAGTPSGTQAVVYVYSGSGPMPLDGGEALDGGSPYVGYWPLVVAAQ